MKKILLTLGTTTVIATPLVTVIACGKSTATTTFEPSFDASTKELTVAKTTYINKSEITSTTSETSVKSFLNDLHTVFFDSAYNTSEKIKLTKNEGEIETITISDITFDPGTTSTNVNVTNLAELKGLSWQVAENASINGKIMDLTANQNMTWQLFSKEKTIIIGDDEDDSSILSELNKLNITSTRTLEELNAVAGTPITTEEEADTRFGIVKTEFDSIVVALGGIASDWKFVNIDFDTTSSKFQLTYKHLNESNNRKIDLATTAMFDDQLIVIELDKLNIHSTKTLTELNAAAGIPATSEANANTRFGIVKTEFDSIIEALGGSSSDWRFVNIDFDEASSKFKLNYKHSSETIDREIHLDTNTKEHDDSAIVSELNKLNITSTKTLRELTNAAGTPATSETDANTRFGIVKAQFDSIIAALGGLSSGWKFVNIDFDTTNSKFKLTYKHSFETDIKEIDLTATPELEDDSTIVSELNKLNITSTKTFTELIAVAGTPATSETDADTRFGIVKTEFDSIVVALGGIASDWKFVNIDFDGASLKFKLTYKHSSEPNNREVNLLTTAKEQDDSTIVSELNQLNIASTKTLRELTNAAGTPATTEEEADTRFGIVKAQFDSIITSLGGATSDWKFVNIDFDTTSSKFKLTYKHSYDTSNREFDLTATPNLEDDSAIVSELNQLNITSTKTLTELTNAAGTPATSETDANTRFGIVKAQFDSIVTALGGETSDWKLVNIDFDTTSSKFKLTYKHSFETNNRAIDLTTTAKHDDSTIVSELNQLNITSTKTLDELEAIAGTPATTEEEANTKFGIVKTEFDSIIAALGGATSDWKLVNIDFDTTNSKFKLTYKHSTESNNRAIDLTTTAKPDDSLIIRELDKLNITSTKTFAELLEATDSNTPATTEEEANTLFGIVKTEFDSIVAALDGETSEWKFVNIDFDLTSLKFKLTYKHLSEPNNREAIYLATTAKPDDSGIITELEKLNITSTKTLTELNAAAGIPATSEADANTKFGIVQTEFAKITTALSGESSDWEFVNIDFNTTSSKFKLTYKHSTESNNREEIDLTTTIGENDDSEIVSELEKLNITSTKTLTELNAVAGTPATSEIDANTRFGIVKTEFDSIITALGGSTSDWKFVNIDFDTTISKFKLNYKHSLGLTGREINLTTTTKLDDSEIRSQLDKLNITSTKTLTELTNAAGTPATSETDADTKFGIVKAQFDSIITALGGATSDWEFVNIDFNTTSSKFKLTYKHSTESNNREEIDLTTTIGENDDSSIVSELEKLNITSTKTLTELIAVAGTPATSETDANTRFGIVKTEFDSIITALGGSTSDWKFVNIDFDTTSSKFKLIYKHSNEISNREIDLTTTTKPDDSTIVSELNKLTITSYWTFTQLIAAAGTPATSEGVAEARFGINSVEFAKITTVLTTGWSFVNIDFDEGNLKFKLTYKHSSETNNKDIYLTTTALAHDPFPTSQKLSIIDLTSTKTLTELTSASGTAATTEEEANTRFGINSIEFKKITDALGSDWRFVNIDFKINDKKMTIDFKHKYESNSYIVIIGGLTFLDDSEIVSELNKLTIISTKGILDLIAAAGTAATTEEEANTRFGINSTEFDKITTALTTDWEFVSIDFDTANSKFRLTFKHSINTYNIKMLLKSGWSHNLDSFVVYSTKTLDELTNAAGTPATTEEEANTRFGIVKAEFDSMIVALVGISGKNNLEFISIDFNTTSSKFRLTFKRSNETNNQEIDLETLFQ